MLGLGITRPMGRSALLHFLDRGTFGFTQSRSVNVQVSASIIGDAAQIIAAIRRATAKPPEFPDLFCDDERGELQPEPAS